ncbi:MAG TPA: hypothetical protein VKR32_10530 [Puia sp.]|nr:hypothetical protein [Puia sp.]
MKKTIDELSSEAVSKYARCMQLEKEFVDRGEDHDAKEQLEKAEYEWETAHSAWEEGLRIYGREKFMKAPE